MKKVTLVIVFALVALFVFAACSQPAAEPAAAATEESAAEAPAAEEPAAEEPAAEEPAAEEPVAEEPAAAESTDLGLTPVASEADVVIGYNDGTQTIEFMQYVWGGLEYEANARGIKILYAESNFNAEQIIPTVETLFLQGANVIIDFNVNAELGGNIVSVAKENGAGVIGIDVEYFAADGSRSWFMGANNQEAGELCGQALGQYAKENKDGKIDKLVLFYNSENGPEVQKRVGGAVEGLMAEGIELSDDQVEWIDMGGGGPDTTVVAKDKFTNWLTANPDLTSIATVGVNDETSQGILAAAETSGRDQDVMIASHNVSQQFIDVAKQGGKDCWVGSVAYYPEHYGEYLVPLAVDIATGKNIDPDNKVTMEHVFVYQTDVDQYEKDFDAYTAKWDS